VGAWPGGGREWVGGKGMGGRAPVHKQLGPSRIPCSCLAVGVVWEEGVGGACVG
jgi:hypothetical protein